MNAAAFDITFYSTSRFEDVFTWKDYLGNPIDLTSKGCKFTVFASDSTELFSKEDDDSEITLGGTAGTVSVNFGTDLTSQPHFNWGWYKLEIFDDTSDETNPLRLIEGKVRFAK